MKTDAELLSSYAATRSETDFAGFVGRRIGFVYHAALRQSGGDAQTAQDIAQAVFTLAAQRAARLAQHAQLSGWLYMTTTHLARRAWRDTRRRAEREQEATLMSEIENDGRGLNSDAGLETHAPDTDRLRPMLDAALGALREGEREAVLLRYFEGRGFAEIGGALKMSEDAARMRVARAVGKMRAAFARRGVTSSAAALGALMSAEAAQAAPAGLASSVSAGAMAAGGAAVTTATTINTFLAFMSSAKITTAAVVALLIAAGGAFYGVQNERAASDALAQARQENVKLASQLREVEKQNAATIAAAAKADREAAGKAFLDDHPEVNEKMAAWTQSIGRRAIFRISREMNLSPGQSAQLAEIASTGGFILNQHVSGYGDVRLRLGNSLPDSKREQAIRDLLGDDGYEKFNELSALDDAGADFNIRKLSTALYFTDAPLTFQQARSLDKIASKLAKNHANITDPQARWNAFMEQARPVLSTAQMSAFMEVGDRNIWRDVSNKWITDYNDARTVTTKTPPPSPR